MKTPKGDELSALQKVLASDEFQGADRLKSFLEYIVREHVEGRGDQILGKNIIEDVYGRSSRRDGESANIVRVDAGRLRRRLSAYYSNQGANDEVWIHVDKGGYAPRFELKTESDVTAQTIPIKQSVQQVSKPPFMGMLVGSLVVAIALAAWVLWPDELEQRSEIILLDRKSEQKLARGVLFETDPVALQAENLAAEARQMLFPATQPTRLLAALTLFEETISLDDSYYGGFAGAAQAAAMFGGLAPLGEQHAEMMRKARSFAEEAVRLDPTKAWSQSVLAFVNMFERNFAEANRLSERAVSLDPDDLFTLEIDAIIAFFSGDFERALENSAPAKHEGRQGSGYPWRNIYGNASFHMGNYDDSISLLYEAAANGDPISEINTAHLIASLQASGRHADAKRHAVEYTKAWPDSRIEEFMLRLFDDPQHAENLISTLREAGWQG
ncbi:tetratricopeptide repeat protein [Tateyamaria sp.]|uniref:tetratricopeptide repeat protein n=1 Tax=Tateyamaria sp. TaxID=1929288 RepID=UPI00329D9A5C